MTDNPESWTTPGSEEPEAIGRFLRDPAVWAQPSADVGDRVLASILAEKAAAEAPADGSVADRWPPPAHPADAARRTEPEPVRPDPAVGGGGPQPGRTEATASASATGEIIDFDRAAERGRRRRGRGRLLPLAAAAAVAIIALGALAAVNLRSDDETPDFTVALAPTELAPDGVVVAEIDERRNGVRIVLDLSGLPPAPDGFFYQAWLVRPEPRNAVSAGTWHLRGGDGSIELWAGVSTEEYTTISVTLSPESDPTSPGDRLFVGQL